MLLPVAQASLAQSNCSGISAFFQKSICTIIENNKPILFKEQLQKKSGQQSLQGLLQWTGENYNCVRCPEEPGFPGGAMLRKAVIDNAQAIALLLVYDARVELNFIEIDGRTLIDWLRDDTERTFDAAFDAESAADRMYLMKQLGINQKYYNLFRNNGAKFRHELEEEAKKLLEEMQREESAIKAAQQERHRREEAAKAAQQPPQRGSAPDEEPDIEE